MAGRAGHAGGRAAPARPQTRVFQSLTISAVRVMVSERAMEAGMDPARTRDLVLAVCELVTNSVRHADGRGVLSVWQEGDALVCEVADRGDPGRAIPRGHPPKPGQVGGYGLWIADQLCDELEVRRGRNGTVTRLRMEVLPVAARASE